MTNTTPLKLKIFSAIQSLIANDSLSITEESFLIGDGGLLDSMRLVELCLLLEDMAAQLGFEFDWTSELAMSKSRSMFRSAGALSAEFISQMEAKK